VPQDDDDGGVLPVIRVAVGAPGWSFEALTDACRDLAAGGRPRLPRGTEATVRAGWFPET